MTTKIVHLKFFRKDKVINTAAEASLLCSMQWSLYFTQFHSTLHDGILNKFFLYTQIIPVLTEYYYILIKNT